MESEISMTRNIECRPISDIRGFILENLDDTGSRYMVMINRFGKVIYYGEFDELDSAVENYKTMMDLAMNDLKMNVN
jgi:hypothetical protein